jgi:hypothetical protein
MTISGFDTPIMLLLLARSHAAARPHACTTCSHHAHTRTHSHSHSHSHRCHRSHTCTPPPPPRTHAATAPSTLACRHPAARSCTLPPSKAAGSEGFRTTQNVCRITHLHWHRPSHRCHPPQLLSDQTSPRPVIVIKIQIILYVLIVVVVNVLSQKYQSSCVI